MKKELRKNNFFYIIKFILLIILSYYPLQVYNKFSENNTCIDSNDDLLSKIDYLVPGKKLDIQYIIERWRALGQKITSIHCCTKQKHVGKFHENVDDKLQSKNEACCLNYIVFPVDFLKYNKKSKEYIGYISKTNCYFLNSYAIPSENNFKIIFKTIFDLIKFNFKDKGYKKIIVHSPALGLGSYAVENVDYRGYLDAVENGIGEDEKIDVLFYNDNNIREELEKNNKYKFIAYSSESIFDEENYQNNNNVCHVILNAGNNGALIGGGGSFEGAICNNIVKVQYLPKNSNTYIIPLVYSYLLVPKYEIIDAKEEIKENNLNKNSELLRRNNDQKSESSKYFKMIRNVILIFGGLTICFFILNNNYRK